MAWKKYISIAIALHLVAIVLYNASSTLLGYQAVYRETDKHSRIGNTAINVLQQIVQWAPLALHARISGIETGYGFFAPQVGSQYLTRFTILDAQGDTLQRIEIPHLQSGESRLRYAGFLDAMQPLTSDTVAADPYERRYARALIHSMADRIAGYYSGAVVSWQVLVYRHPPLRNRHHYKPRLIAVYSSTRPIGSL